jgi:hypothetical protein
MKFNDQYLTRLQLQLMTYLSAKQDRCIWIPRECKNSRNLIGAIEGLEKLVFILSEDLTVVRPTWRITIKGDHYIYGQWKHYPDTMLEKIKTSYKIIQSEQSVTQVQI